MSSKHLLPHNLSKLIDNGQKRTNEEVIIDYIMSPEGTVPLNKEQEALYQRWTYADDLIRSRKHTSNAMAQALKKKFDYSIATAWNDLAAAKRVFNTRVSIPKNYLTENHLTRIEDAMIRAEEQGDEKTAVLLYEVYNHALKLIKDEGKVAPPPTAIIFSIYNNTNILPDEFSKNDAIEASKEFLKENDIEDIDYTDL